MSRELEALKRELDCRMLDLAKMSGTNKQRAEVYRILKVIERIEKNLACENCAYWNDGECDENPTEPWDICSRRVEDNFEPKE